MQLAALATAAELPKSTAHRIVTALIDEDLIAPGPSGRLRLGPGLARLGAASRRSLAADVLPALERLQAAIDETVDLAVLDGSTARFIEQLPASHRLRAVSAVGVQFPLHCTANGKALLAALPDIDVRARLPAHLPRLTPNTITSHDALGAELDRIRRDQIAYDREEHTEGISAVGAAVYDAAGLAGAISVPAPTTRFRGQEQVYGDAVRDAAREASRLAGSTSPS